MTGIVFSLFWPSICLADPSAVVRNSII